MPLVRLHKFLSDADVAARRKAETLIKMGVVTVNRKIVQELGVRIDPKKDVVQVRGQVAVPQEKIYLVLNKPKGYVSTVSDPQGRPTVMDLLPNLPVRVRPMGRLDYYTEGVLLFTNDGELQAQLLSPNSHVPKTYHVKVKGRVDPRHIERWRAGVRLKDGVITQPAKVDVVKFTGTHTWLVVTITEGKSRQIHRMVEALGYQVLKLARVAFGGITYFGLKIGEWRYLTRREVKELQKPASGLRPQASARIRKLGARNKDTEIRIPMPGARRRRSDI